MTAPPRGKETAKLPMQTIWLLTIWESHGSEVDGRMSRRNERGALARSGGPRTGGIGSAPERRTQSRLHALC